MHEDTRQSLLRRHLQQRIQMAHMRVNTAVAHQADQVQRVVAFACAMHCLQERGVFEELASLDSCVDARHIHSNDATSTKIEMADFAVAHLAVRQANEVFARADKRIRIFAKQLVVGRLAREGDRIATRLNAVSPSVEDSENYRAVLTHNYAPQFTLRRPRNSAVCPSSSSIRRSWLYFAMRSVREAEPVLI